jgi:hypothetical protein
MVELTKDDLKKMVEEAIEKKLALIKDEIAHLQRKSYFNERPSNCDIVADV